VQQSLGSGVIVPRRLIVHPKNMWWEGGTDIIVALSDRASSQRPRCCWPIRAPTGGAEDRHQRRTSAVGALRRQRCGAGGSTGAGRSAIPSMSASRDHGHRSDWRAPRFPLSDYQFFTRTDDAIIGIRAALVTTDGTWRASHRESIRAAAAAIDHRLSHPAKPGAAGVVEGVEGRLEKRTAGQWATGWVGASGQPVTSAMAYSSDGQPGGVRSRHLSRWSVSKEGVNRARWCNRLDVRRWTICNR